MQRVDLDNFQRLMAELYECYSHKPPSAAVLQHWVDALRDHPFATVDNVIRNWIRTKPKLPVIADITKTCADIFSDRVEQRAAADKRAFAQEVPHAVTPYGEQCIREIRALLAKPKRPSKEWARKIMENPNSTEFQRNFAKPVYEDLLHSEGKRERVPGEDDEPLAEAA